MKANELMIGDWVFCEGQPIPSNVTIETIAEDGVWFNGDQFEGAASYDRIFPIPIAPEVLEKNGFIKNESASPKVVYWKLSLRDKYFQIFRSSIKNDIYGYPKEKEFQPSGDYEVQCFNRAVYSNGDRCEHFATLYASSVHELQHIIRLCEIDKEIVL